VTIRNNDSKINREKEEKQSFIFFFKKRQKLLLTNCSINLCLEESWINISMWNDALPNYENEPGVHV